jgi:hypothetical protein
MHTKRHRQNHDFTILYNLVGACHTADQAHALLLDLREERQMALDNYEVQKIRYEAREIRARRMLDSADKAVQAEGRAEMMELSHNRRYGEVLSAAARDEVAFIDRCIAEIQPRRKYAHLPEAEAVEAIQAEEWELELMARVENFLATTGTIPPDEFANMRTHPRFAESILPHINEIATVLKRPDGLDRLADEIRRRPRLLEGIGEIGQYDRHHQEGRSTS